MPPRKGARTLNLLMNELYDVQPGAVGQDDVGHAGVVVQVVVVEGLRR